MNLGVATKMETVDPPGPDPLLRTRAYAAFVARLKDGRLAPGRTVTQRELVKITGQPLGAVREMIPRLEAEGLIHTVPQRGLRIPSINLDLIRDCFQLRLVLEREAFLVCCRTADGTDLADLAVAHRALRARVVDGQAGYAEVRALDSAFHQRVVDACGSRLLAAVHRVNQVKIEMIRNADPARSAARMTAVLDEHLAVIYALQARNPGRATSAIQAHLENARKRTLGL